MPNDLKRTLLKAFPEDRQYDPLAAEVSEKTANFLEATTRRERLDTFRQLKRWLEKGLADEAIEDSTHSGKQRVLLFFWLCEHSPGVTSQIRSTLDSMLAETESINLFAEVGIPNERGFLAEGTDRLFRWFLPTPRDDFDLSQILRQLFRTENQAEVFANLSPKVFDRLVNVLYGEPAKTGGRWGTVVRGFEDGFRVLLARVMTQGLSYKIRARAKQPTPSQSPFLLLFREGERILQHWSNGELEAESLKPWQALIEECRREMAEVSLRLESEGVSVDIVYGIEVLEVCLQRLTLMVMIMENPEGAERNRALHQLLATLVIASHHEKSLRHLITSNLRMLHRKIVDRSGKTGEHYVAMGRSEYRHIWIAAAGGGLLTTITAAVKMKISHAGLPLFVEGMLSGTNYAVSFLALQYFGFMLATKQPAMTAALLAKILRERGEKNRADEIIAFSARICHSQLAATISNVIVVSAGAYLFAFLWQLAFKTPYLNAHDAEQVFQTLSPVNSGTIFYAALTGAILWLSSLIGGWFDNWTVYHRLPLALRDSVLTERFGQQRMVKWSGIFERNVSGWATNISLGFMLGMTPVLGHFFGAPLDVRHVTLSTGTLALACASLSKNWAHGNWLILAGLGVATMFVLNLGVSFCLSLFTAIRAYDLKGTDGIELLRALGRKFLKSPRDFFIPPRNTQKGPA